MRAFRAECPRNQAIGQQAPDRVRGRVVLAVWLRNVIGIRRVGRWRRTPGASTGSSERARREEWPDARDPPERPHHPGRARRDRPLERALRRPGRALQRLRRNHPHKWRKRGLAERQDRSSRPHKLPWKASEEERAVVCALRRATGFPLDDLTFVVRHFLPHLDRDNVYRVLRAAGLSRRPAPATPEKVAGKFKEYELGFVH